MLFYMNAIRVRYDSNVTYITILLAEHTYFGFSLSFLITFFFFFSIFSFAFLFDCRAAHIHVSSICVRLIFLSSNHYAGWIYIHFYYYFIYRSPFRSPEPVQSVSLLWILLFVYLFRCYFGWSRLCKSPILSCANCGGLMSIFRLLTEWGMTSAMTTIFDFIVVEHKIHVVN